MKHAGCNADSVPTDDCMELREKVKKVEFAAEKMQQEALDSLADGSRVREEISRQVLQDVVRNLRTYAAYAGFEFGADVRKHLSVVISAAYPDWQRRAIEDALES